jgi:tetratricopeptide (TPR) repeat protein
LAETQALTGERGAYQLVRDLPAIHVPDTVQAILSSRIDRLPAEQKQLLEIAAVIGQMFPFALLQTVADQPEDVLRRALGHLHSAELVYETHSSSDLEYTFKHALTHEVAYGSLLYERRRDLHARIVGAMERLYEHRLGEQIERLAHHSLRGDLREKAVHYLRQAGLRAAARSALQEARVWLEQGLAVLGALGESRTSQEQAFEICLDLRSVLNLLGDVRSALEHLHEAEALAEKLDDDSRRGRVCVFMTNVHALLGEVEEALAWGARSLTFARRLDDSRLRIQTTSYLEQVHYYQGAYARAVELATDNLAALPAGWISADANSRMPTALWDRLWLVYSLAELGRFDEATSYGADLLALAEPTQHSFAVSEAYISPSRLHLLKGEWLKARLLVEQGIAVLRAGNTFLNLPTALAWSAWILAQVGEASDALARVREGERVLGRLAAGKVVLNGLSYQSLGRACLLLDLPDEAWRLGTRAVECAPCRLGVAAHALHLLGDIATHPHRFDAQGAEAHYQNALALAGSRGMRPLIAHCHLGLGRLYRRTGKGPVAQEHITIAKEFYREMGMQFWLEEAEAMK